MKDIIITSTRGIFRCSRALRILEKEVVDVKRMRERMESQAFAITLPSISKPSYDTERCQLMILKLKASVPSLKKGTKRATISTKGTITSDRLKTYKTGTPESKIRVNTVIKYKA
jgi:hypothetical protein